jgi:hypothetical protein
MALLSINGIKSTREPQRLNKAAAQENTRNSN